MDLVKLTEFIFNDLVKDKNKLSIKQTISDDKTIYLEVFLSNSDLEQINTDKRLIASIKNIIQASAYLNHDKRVSLKLTLA